MVCGVEIGIFLCDSVGFLERRRVFSQDINKSRIKV